MVYTSSTLALAALEYLVHVDPEDLPDDLVAMKIHIPDALSETRVDVSDLPSDWNRVLDHPACLERGHAWLQDAIAAVLRVPSAIVPEEENVLINPRHTDARRIIGAVIRPFADR